MSDAAHVRAIVGGHPILTDREHALVDKLGECASEYKAILASDPARQGRLASEEKYPWDVAEFVAHIHDLQHAVMARACHRLWPHRYRP